MLILSANTTWFLRFSNVFFFHPSKRGSSFQHILNFFNIFYPFYDQISILLQSISIAHSQITCSLTIFGHCFGRTHSPVHWLNKYPLLQSHISIPLNMWQASLSSMWHFLISHNPTLCTIVFLRKWHFFTCGRPYWASLAESINSIKYPLYKSYKKNLLTVCDTEDHNQCQK